MLFVFLEKNSILSKRNDHLHAMTYHCRLSSSEKFVQLSIYIKERTQLARFMLSIFSVLCIFFVFILVMEALTIHFPTISGCNVQF